MSASKKKKLRSEGAEKLTERQIAEQKEAKKLKLYSILFVAVMVALVAIAAVVGVTRTIEASGIHEKNTVAATIGNRTISNAELSYYYLDSVNNFNNTYGSYASIYGIDPSVSLNKQVMNEETGETWADNFIAEAVSNAQSIFALEDAAKAAGFTLPEESKAQLETLSSNLDAYAALYNYPDVDSFLKAQYGRGASKAGYLEYYERNLLAAAYESNHQNNELNITPERIRAKDSENPAAYSSYNYNQYYLSASKFQTGGTTDENGNTTYSAEEKAAAAKAAEEAAATLTAETVTTIEELDAAIAALEVNKDTSASSTAYSNQRYSAINSNLVEWITDASRQEGEMTCIPTKSTSTDEAGNEVENITGYYVVRYTGVNTNETALVNVRHILIGFDGEPNEDGTYTDEIKAAARTTADEVLAEWTAGDANEESFAALANDKSTDPGSNTTGGLYENVYPGQMVAPFDAWCFDAGRKAGDTGIVETDYGYHVMYFVSTSEQTYRDFQIENELRSEDMSAWHEELLANYAIEKGDTSYMNKDIVLSR